ncbi:glucuronate isomerase [uncultured Roseibium sp.]|uniref:glucuronate isomerase n=1 Tax=uncultured Roseibium sp. TaxID=1936171 RepID=UPI00260CFAB4|nr:glucuronate isomerase [uncultured Roseibium sp.]
MTAPFLGPDFLLDTPSSLRLYHEVAAPLPLVDFHNHLDPAAIAGNRSWSSIGEIWLEGDHYKWRAMRWNGVPEELVTGDADFRQKFDAFAATVPHCLGNPLYHWTHLELKRYFGWNGVFGPETADEVWEIANAKLAEPTHSARGLLHQMNVGYVGTTDDPCDDLTFHGEALRDPDLGFKIAPSFRPDKTLAPSDKGFAGYCRKLGTAAEMRIERFEDLIGALIKRLDHFITLGCKASDHGLSELPPFSSRSSSDLDDILASALEGDPVSSRDEADFKAAVLIELGQAYRQRNIVMQFHIGASRNNSSRLLEGIGPDTGGDSISDSPVAGPLNSLLDQIDRRGGLPRTILYCLNPALNEVMVTIAGNFQDGSEPGKIQSGPAWWFNDQLEGMERHLTQVAQMGLLSRFIGMLTDSRSFLSFPRHEYYRRLVCRIVGHWTEDGSIPNDTTLADGLIRRICHENARDWFLQ